MLEGIGGEIRWEQLITSVFVAAVLVRGCLGNGDSNGRVRSSLVSLIGCALLAADAAFRPDGLVLLGPALLCFAAGLAWHLLTKGWRSDGGSA